MLAEAHRQARRRLSERSPDQATAQRAADIDKHARLTVEMIEHQADQDAAESLRWLRGQLDALDQVLARQLLSSEEGGEPVGADPEPSRAFTAQQSHQVVLAKLDVEHHAA